MSSPNQERERHLAFSLFSLRGAFVMFSSFAERLSEPHRPATLEKQNSPVPAVGSRAPCRPRFF